MSRYTELLRQGPFPSRIDPWAEQGHYFHQLHGSMITYILSQITEPLMELGYRIGREPSLQVLERGSPDIYISDKQSTTRNKWDYSQALASSSIEAGLALIPDSLELDALFIREGKSGQLVTVLELISPSNKTDSEDIQIYKSRRRRYKEDAVHIVEVDLTRSLKRLLDEKIVQQYPYHILIHLHNDYIRFIGMHLTDAPKSFALPLVDNFVAVELSPVYRRAYEEIAIAWHIQEENQYAADKYPFPSMISAEEHQTLIRAVAAWQAELSSNQESA